MGACRFKDRAIEGRCSHLNDGICNNRSALIYRCIDSIASVSLDRMQISYSQMRSWDRCPRKWAYEQIMGLKIKEPYQSINLRMGKEIQRLIAKQPGPPTFFSDKEQHQLQIIYIILEIMQQREMLAYDNAYGIELFRNAFHGIMDVAFSKETFGEIKFTGSPDWYFNNSSAWDQLERYFYLDPDKEWGILLPIRVPGLKDKDDEDQEYKLNRIRSDISKRFNHYFPGYDYKKENPKWGRSFSRNEFDLEEFEEKFNWTKKEIQTACKVDNFVHRRGNCLNPGPCDFIPLCEGRNINWELYERRNETEEQGGDLGSNT